VGPDTRVKQNPESPTRKIDDFEHVLDTATGTLHTFNEVGARIWALIETERPVSEVIAAIVEEYDVDPAEAEEDVLGFLGDLHEKGLVLVA